MTRADVIARLKAAEPRIRAHGVAALYLYGSYARDEAGPESDVDVFVDPETDDFYALGSFMGTYFELQSALDGKEIGYGTRGGLSTYIRSSVETQAIRVF